MFGQAVHDTGGMEGLEERGSLDKTYSKSLFPRVQWKKNILRTRY